MDSRMKIWRMVLVICLGLLLVSCAASLLEGEKWLNTKNDNPKINISGAWSSPEWGAATFKQQGRDISGTIGDYPAKGVVSGEKLYLLMYDRNRVDYFAELKAVDKYTFQGSYSQKWTVEEVRRQDPKLLRPITLRRPMVEGEKWLDSKQEKPEINIAGEWVSPEWGPAKFKQQGSEIMGIVGDYPAKGIVSGSNLYLLMYSSHKVDYYAELKAVDEDTFEGSYSKDQTVEEARKKNNPTLLRPINLKRIAVTNR